MLQLATTIFSLVKMQAYGRDNIVYWKQQNFLATTILLILNCADTTISSFDKRDKAQLQTLYARSGLDQRHANQHLI